MRNELRVRKGGQVDGWSLWGSGLAFGGRQKNKHVPRVVGVSACTMRRYPWDKDEVARRSRHRETGAEERPGSTEQGGG